MNRKLLQQLKDSGYMIATAESCTGGLIAAKITQVPGASDAFDRGFVTYSNAAKQEMLGVPAALIKKHGAVSAEVAEAMAKGALKHSMANVAIAVTGLLGPGGGSSEKPVGLVYIACAVLKQKAFHARFDFGTMGRTKMRSLVVDAVMAMLEGLVQRGTSKYNMKH